MEPAHLAGATDTTLVVQAMRAVPLTHRWCWPLLIGVVAVVASTSREIARGRRAIAVGLPVVNRRCIECHSGQPTATPSRLPLKGLLDTAPQMKKYARRIEGAWQWSARCRLRTWLHDYEERWVLGRWWRRAKVP